MKYTVTLSALLAAACISPEQHRRVVGERNALQTIKASMEESQQILSAENERLRAENRDLSVRAADSSWVADQKQRLANLLEKYGAGSPSAAAGVELVQTPEGFAFRIASGVLFPSGQNSLSDQGKRTLEELAKQLIGRNVRIEGHTDDEPIQRSNWGTNLRLSVERAMVVADYLTTAGGLNAEQVSAAGYSQYRPAVEGSDEASRQRNRRIEILFVDDIGTAMPPLPPFNPLFRDGWRLCQRRQFASSFDGALEDAVAKLSGFVAYLSPAEPGVARDAASGATVQVLRDRAPIHDGGVVRWRHTAQSKHYRTVSDFALYATYQSRSVRLFIDVEVWQEKVGSNREAGIFFDAAVETAFDDADNSVDYVWTWMKNSDAAKKEAR